MPKFTVERNWIECIGPLWMGGTAAKRIDLSSSDIDNILGYAEHLSGERVLTREAVEHWLCLNEGDLQHVADFAAFIKDATFPWKDEESEFTYHDCTYGTEE